MTKYGGSFNVRKANDTHVSKWVQGKFIEEIKIAADADTFKIT